MERTINKAIFCDRDGVITKLVKREETSSAPAQETCPWFPEEIDYFPYVKEAIAKAHDLGYKFFIVTNQPDFTPFATGAIKRINSFLTDECQIDDIAISSMKGCHNYKPNPGMVERLTRRWNIDITQSWMIGDSWKDCVCAHLAGVRHIHVGDKNPVAIPTAYTNSLFSAIEYIERHDDPERQKDGDFTPI